jgi:hypothetical protein
LSQLLFKELQIIYSLHVKKLEEIMNRKNMYEFGILIFVIFLIIFLSGCRTPGRIYIGNGLHGPAPSHLYENGSPPPWAPAHGNRVKHIYRYYPYHGIYFEEKAGVYFYLSDGRWQMAASLPAYIRITVNDFVALDMDTDRPYEYHNHVIKKYPPGQQKKNSKVQNEENRKGNNKRK